MEIRAKGPELRKAVKKDALVPVLFCTAFISSSSVREVSSLLCISLHPYAASQSGRTFLMSEETALLLHLFILSQPSLPLTQGLFQLAKIVMLSLLLKALEHYCGCCMMAESYSF